MSFPIETQPGPAVGFEGSGSGGGGAQGMDVPTPEQFIGLRDTAVRRGPDAMAGYNQLVQSFSEHPDADKALLQRLILPDVRHMDYMQNYASMKGENPVDMDGAGSNGMLAYVQSKKAMDAYNEKLAQTGAERGEYKSDGPVSPYAAQHIQPKYPEPELRPVPGYSVGQQQEGIFPFVMTGRDGRAGAPIPPTLKAGAGSLPAESNVLTMLDTMVQSDLEEILGTPQDEWSDEDYALAATLQYGEAQLLQNNPEDGLVLESFLGGPISNLGALPQAIMGQEPEERPTSEEAALDLTIGGLAGIPNPAGMLRYAGAKLREAGAARGEATAQHHTKPDQLTAQEYRGLLHHAREQGKVPWSESDINNFSDEMLIDKLQTMQDAGRAARRQELQDSYQLYGELAFTFVPGMAVERYLSGTLAAARFGLGKLTAGRKAWMVAERMLAEGAVNGALAASFADRDDRVATGLMVGGLAAAIPLGGAGFRFASNKLTPGTTIVTPNAVNKFRGSLIDGLTKRGTDERLAGYMADQLADWHSENWMVYGNGILEGAAKRQHIVDQVAERFVTEGAVRAQQQATPQMISAVQKALTNPREMANALARARKKLVAQVVDAQELDAIAEDMSKFYSADLITQAKGFLKAIKFVGMDRYLKRMGKIPGMKERLEGILIYQNRRGMSVDKLDDMLKALDEISPDTPMAAVKEAEKIVADLNAAAKDLAQWVAEEQSRIKVERRAIDREVAKLFDGLPDSWRRFIMRDPKQELGALQAEMALRLEREGVSEHSSTAAQSSAAMEEAGRLRREIAKLGKWLDSRTERIESSVTKQHRRLEQDIAKLESAYVERVERTIADDVQARAKATKARLTKQMEEEIAAGEESPAAIQDRYERMIFEQTRPDVLEESIRRESADKFVAEREAYYKAKLEDREITKGQRDHFKRQLKRIADWRRLKSNARRSDGIARTPGVKWETKRHHESRGGMYAALAGKTEPKGTSKAHDIFRDRDTQSILDELSKKEAEYEAVIENVIEQFGKGAEKVGKQKADAAERLLAVEGQLDKLRGLMGRKSADDIIKRFEAVRDELSPKMQALRAAGKQPLPEGMGKGDYNRLSGEYRKLREAGESLAVLSEKVNRDAQQAHVDAVRTVRTQLANRFRAVGDMAESVASMFDEVTRDASKRGYDNFKAHLGRFIDDPAQRSEFERVFDGSHLLGDPLKNLPNEALRKEMGQKLAETGRLLKQAVLGADKALHLGGRGSDMLLRWAEEIGDLSTGSLKRIGDIPFHVAEQILKAADSGLNDSLRRRQKDAIRGATRSLASMLAQDIEINPKALADLEDRFMLPTGTLDKVGAPGVAKERARMIKEFEGRSSMQRLDDLLDPVKAPILAEQYGGGFSPGYLKRITDETGKEGQEAVIEGLRRAINRSAPWGPRNLLSFRNAINFFRQRGMSPMGRVFFQNFMVFDEGLGTLGLNVTPVLDAIMRGAQKEADWSKMLRRPLMDAVESAEKLYRSARAEGVSPGQVNTLITDYRMAMLGDKNARYKMDAVLGMADDLGVDYALLEKASAAFGAFYEAGESQMKQVYRGIGILENYTPVMRVKKMSTARGKRASIKDADIKKKRNIGVTGDQEYDAVALASNWYDQAIRSAAYSEVGDATEVLIQSLRGVLPGTKVGKTHVEHDVVTALREVIDYAQGRGKRYKLWPGFRGFAKLSSKMQGLMLSHPRTAIRNAGDMLTVMNATDLAPSRFLRNNYESLRRSFQYALQPIKTDEFRRIESILDREGSLGTIDRATTSSMVINQAFERGISAAKSEAIEANGGAVMDHILLLNHYFDKRGRIAAYKVGEDLAQGALEAAKKEADPIKAFKAFQDHIGYGKFSDGEWNELYHLIGKGDDQAVREFTGVHMSRAMLFNYFPGAGSKITKHPFARSMVPFYSYLSQRGYLLFRAIARGNPSEIAGAVATEALAGVSRIPKVSAIPFMDIPQQLSAVQNYWSYLYSVGGGYSGEDDQLRHGLRITSPAAATVALTAHSAFMASVYAAKLSSDDMDKFEKWVYANGESIGVGAGLGRVRDIENLRKHTKAFSDDLRNLIDAIGWMRLAIEGLNVATDIRPFSLPDGAEVTQMNMSDAYPLLERINDGLWRSRKRAADMEGKHGSKVRLTREEWRKAIANMNPVIQKQYMEGTAHRHLGAYADTPLGSRSFAAGLIRQRLAERFDSGENLLKYTMVPMLRHQGHEVDRMKSGFRDWHRQWRLNNVK